MMGEKSVLFIVPNLNTGGAERQSVTVARLLAYEGYKVRFLTYSEGDVYRDLLEEAGVSVCVKKVSKIKRLIAVVKYIRTGNFSAVISFMQTPNFLNNFAALSGKKWKVITSIRATPQKNEFQSFQGRIYGKFYHKSDIIVSNSNHSLKVFGSFFPEYRPKFKTIYNAVQLGNVNSKYYIKKGGCLNVVVAATVSDIKNPFGLLEALELMSKDERDSIRIKWYGKIEIVPGDHYYYDSVIEAVKKRRLEDTITFYDSTKEISSVMNEADCIALFSRLEGLPNAICEGMMLSKPIIMTRCSDYDILVKDGISGFLCDWDKPISIKEALLKMASLPDNDLRDMGKKSNEIASQLFTEDVICRQWVELIEE